jgi:phage portal protein BeeE
MGLLRYLRGDDLLEDRNTEPAGEARSLPRPDNELPLAGAYTAYGAFGEKSITPAKALQIADVWACVRVLADAASSLPLHVYRDAPAGGGRERVRTGRLPDLLGRPGPATSQADLVSSLVAHLAIYGSAYIAKYRQGGELTQLGLLHPTVSSLSLRTGSSGSATARAPARSGG